MSQWMALFYTKCLENIFLKLNYAKCFSVLVKNTLVFITSYIIIISVIYEKQHEIREL